MRSERCWTRCPPLSKSCADLPRARCGAYAIVEWQCCRPEQIPGGWHFWAHCMGGDCRVAANIMAAHVRRGACESRRASSVVHVKCGDVHCAIDRHGSRQNDARPALCIIRCMLNAAHSQRLARTAAAHALCAGIFRGRRRLEPLARRSIAGKGSIEAAIVGCEGAHAPCNLRAHTCAVNENSL